MKRASAVLLVTSCIAGLMSTAYADEHKMMSDTELMADLNGAAPAHIVAHATIMNMGADGKMKVIQKGTNGWTCMDPGAEPMCADEAAMEWVNAWQTKGPAPQKLGFVYMLKGDGGTSNTDPYAAKKNCGQQLGQDGTARDDHGRRGQEHADVIPEEPDAGPHQPLCHVARHSVRTSDVAHQVRAIRRPIDLRPSGL